MKDMTEKEVKDAVDAALEKAGNGNAIYYSKEDASTVMDKRKADFIASLGE